MAFEEVRTLAELVTLVRGTTYKSALLGQPGPVLLGLASIQRNGGFRSDSLKTYGGDSKEKLLLRPGDLFVSLKDVTQSADLLGAIARVPMEVELGRLTQDTVKLEFRDHSYSQALVYWALRSPDFRAYCRAHATGTTNLGLSREDFLAYELPAATPEVLSLVQVLESIEERVTMLGRVNVTLQEIAQALFKSWFVDFDAVRAKAEGRELDGMDVATAALLPSELVDSEIGPIPKGWLVDGLGKVSQNVRNQAKPNELEPNTRYIGLEHMPRKSIALTDPGIAEGLVSGKFWYRENDILFGKLRPYFHKVGVAEGDGVCSTDILVIRPRSLHWFGYTVMQFSSDAVVSYATQISNGAKMPRVSWGDLATYRAAIPPDVVAERFDSIIRPIIGRVHANMAISRTLKELRDTLLSRLMPGRIRLPTSAPTDVVA